MEVPTPTPPVLITTPVIESAKIMPGVATMANNLISTIGTAAVHAITNNGQVFVSEEEGNRRYALCEGCEFYDTVQFRCMKCGCFMKGKVKMVAAKCPINKW